MVQPQEKTVWRFLKRLQIELPYDPAIHIGKNKNTNSKRYVWDFPGGPVVKNPPSNAGDMGLIPGRGTKIPHATGQLSLHAATTEPAHSRAHMPQLLSPHALEPACRNEEPARCSERSHVPQ